MASSEGAVRARVVGWLLAAAALAGPVAGFPGEEARSAPTAPPGGRLVLEAEWGGLGSEPGQLDHPMGLAVGPDDRIYVADSANERIQVFTPEGDLLAVWKLPAGARPVGLLPRPGGRLLVADTTGDQVLVLDADGRLLESWRGGAADPLRAPSGLAATPAGTILVVEFMGQRLRELDASGRFLRFLGGDRFVYPSDVAVTADGTIYVSNTHAYEILVLGAAGGLASRWGEKGSAPGEWEVPVGVALDAAGNLYVADSANFRVQVLDPHGRPLLATRADELWYRGRQKKLYSPTDLGLDSQGRLFVADFAASRIERFRVELP